MRNIRSDNPQQVAVVLLMKRLQRQMVQIWRSSSTDSRATSTSSIGTDPFASREMVEQHLFRSCDSTDKILGDLMESDNFQSADSGIGILEPVVQARLSNHLKSSDVFKSNGAFNSRDWTTSDFINVGDYSTVFQSRCNSYSTPQLVEETIFQTGQNSEQQECAPREDNKRKSPNKKSDAFKEYIEGDFTEVDVLMGRGGLANKHPGNQAFLGEKERLQDRYLAASKNDKTGISQELVDGIHARGGRFIKQDNSGQWYEVDDRTARKKGSQTLREINTAESRALKRAKYTRK